MTGNTIIVGLVLSAVGFFLGYLIRQQIAKSQSNSIEAKLTLKLQQSKDEAKEIILAAKDKSVRLLEEIKVEEKKRKELLDKNEERILHREELMDKRHIELDSRSKDLEAAVEKVKAFKLDLDKFFAF